MATRRPALIFDFGNVVAFFDYNRAGQALGRSLDLSGEEFMHRVRQLGFAGLLGRFESGAMSAEDFGRELCGLVGLSLPHEDFAAAFADIFTLNEPIAGLLPELKQMGHTLVLGSNTNELHSAQFRRQFAAELVPEGTDRNAAGVGKPLVIVLHFQRTGFHAEEKAPGGIRFHRGQPRFP